MLHIRSSLKNVIFKLSFGVINQHGISLNSFVSKKIFVTLTQNPSLLKGQTLAKVLTVVKFNLAPVELIKCL